MPPNPHQHKPEPSYLRGLIEQIGVSQVEAAKRLGIDPSTLRRYLMPMNRKQARQAPYLLQYALECWAMEKHDSLLTS